MKQIHKNLEEKMPWYQRWHKNPNHSVVHYIILAVFVVFMISNLSSSKIPDSSDLIAQAKPFGDLRFSERMGGKRELSGAEAVKALGLDIARVARHYGMSARDLRNEFNTSTTLHINGEALLFYVEEVPQEAKPVGGGGGGGGSPTPSYSSPTFDEIPDELTFKLHSKSNATAKIYLDFDGATVSNTSWNATGTITALPYTFDADPAFSPTELNEIKAIWRSVAEDFAPFNVDVTTEQPTSYDIYHYIRIIITPSWEWFGKAGGVSFINSFRWGDGTPAFVFSSLLSNNTKNIAEATSHEVGHTLGLRHQSVYDANGAKIAEYNSGWGVGSTSFAPIMGVSYNRTISAFIDSGEYPNWSSSSGYATEQNDVGIITAPSSITGDLRFVTDETGGETVPAQQLNKTVSDGVAIINQYGIMAQNDVDLYRIDALAGDIKITVNPLIMVAILGNADFRVRLLDSTLNILAESNSPGVATAYVEKLGATEGVYYLEISPSGYSDPNGWWYTATSSMGQYKVTGSYLPSSSTNPPSSSDVTAPVVSITNPADGVSITSSSSVTISASATDNVKVTKIEILVNGSVIKSSTKSSISYRWSTRGLSAGTYTITVRAYDAGGNVGGSSVTVYK